MKDNLEFAKLVLEQENYELIMHITFPGYWDNEVCKSIGTISGGITPEI